MPPKSNLAISRATYTQVIGNPPGQLRPAEPVDRYLPRKPANDAHRDGPSRSIRLSFAAGVRRRRRIDHPSMLPRAACLPSITRARQRQPTAKTGRSHAQHLQDRPRLR